MLTIAPFDGAIIIEYTPVSDLWRALHLSVIEPIARKSHDFLIHSVLYFQQSNRFGLVFDNAFHERFAQSGPQRGDTFHRRRQLAVVSCQHDTRHAPHRNPAGSLQSLCRFVDKECSELHSFKRAMG